MAFKTKRNYHFLSIDFGDYFNRKRVTVSIRLSDENNNNIEKWNVNFVYHESNRKTIDKQFSHRPTQNINRNQTKLIRFQSRTMTTTKCIVCWEEKMKTKYVSKRFEIEILVFCLSWIVSILVSAVNAVEFTRNENGSDKWRKERKRMFIGVVGIWIKRFRRS